MSNAYRFIETTGGGGSGLSANDYQQSPLSGRSLHRIILLSSSLGTGHSRAAEAIHIALHDVFPDLEIDTIDFWSLMDAAVADKLKQGYLTLVTRYPELYDRVYRIDQTIWRALLKDGIPPPPLLQALQLLPASIIPNTWRWLAPGNGAYDRALLLSLVSSIRDQSWPTLDKIALRGLLHLSWDRLARQLAQRLEISQADLCISTQMLPAALLSRLKQRQITSIPSIGVLTDFGVHDFWVQKRTDHYCVATEQMAMHLLQSGVSCDRIHVTGIPLYPDFSRARTIPQARQTLGLDRQKPAVLLMAGGLGLGLTETVTSLLNTAIDMQLLVVTGENSQACQTLQQRFPTENRLHLYGWTDQIALMMYAADIVISKPGGITTAEAMACGRPLLATRSLGGQENFNVAFIEQQGIGRLVPDDQLGMSLKTLLGNHEELKRLQKLAWQSGKRDSTKKIIEVITSICNEINNQPLLNKRSTA